MTPDPDYDRLVRYLRAWACGDLRLEANVQLLLSHDHWLRRDDFRTACIRAGYGGLDRSLTLAFIAPEAAAAAAQGPDALPASANERRILALAAGLANATVGVPLGELLTGPDATNTARVLNTVAHATGHPNTHR